METQKITVCGVNCATCTLLGNECKGCDSIKGCVFWAQYINADVCPLYSCVKQKGLTSCGACELLPCNLWTDLKDPNQTDEQHQQSITDRITLLRAAYNKKAN